jgi:uncharacterized protein YqeY
MSNQVSIKGWVREARYYPQEKSILVVLEDVESKKRLKPVQVSISTFKAMGIQASLDDDDAWVFFAKELLRRKDPINLFFEGSKNDEDPI